MTMPFLCVYIYSKKEHYVSRFSKMSTTLDPAIPLLGIYPEEVTRHAHKGLWAWMLIAA